MVWAFSGRTKISIEEIGWKTPVSLSTTLEVTGNISPTQSCNDLNLSEDVELVGKASFQEWYILLFSNELISKNRWSKDERKSRNYY